MSTREERGKATVDKAEATTVYTCLYVCFYMYIWLKPQECRRERGRESAGDSRWQG